MRRQVGKWGRDRRFWVGSDLPPAAGQGRWGL